MMTRVSGSLAKRLKKIYKEPSVEQEKDDDDENVDDVYNQWSSPDNVCFFPSSKTVKSVEPGVYYGISTQSRGIGIKRIDFMTGNLIKFPDTVSDRVIFDIEKFWKSADEYAGIGEVYKRGILLHGDPGHGKTCTINMVIKDLIENRNGIVLMFRDPNIDIEAMRIIRKIEKSRPLVVLMEDIDAIIDRHEESDILNLLDGVNQMENVVFLATTNYPEKLGGRVTNRPSRFDRVFEIAPPGTASRKMYIEHLVGNYCKYKKIDKAPNINIANIVEDTANLSFAHIKELVLSTLVYGYEYNDTVKVLKGMKKVKKTGKDVGFNE
jgi:Cdc6-like AAA superfamily ATPase